ncbi:response regulator [Mesorhizobium sp. B2-5-9]|nr:response regulator [Mesorhizobium sp. B2-7-3]TPK09027.1 response regulator [Mesorhizobium sp. B2-5-7]TPK12753.1 response regulator [Mesorhizobium sp. B2-5-9]TPK76899.1 response regulator [Mesorhizobium sp. B2-4-18]TPK85843.1 response regulator [Mesorhizobium sp. B2-4-13]TPL73673.1 response regulator [Mesorhizobium sp. B2-3-15]TPL84933.1 response regulator [Mesorhizobium sp. B2-3-14]TPL96487.1 response regulator [Mesorhizobium sp. B2-3-10]
MTGKWKCLLCILNSVRRKDDDVRDLRGLHLLIVEDEWSMAGDLARFFSNMGAIILGPAATVEQASEHTDQAEAAILDVNLNGRRVFPIADKLMRRGIPFVFFSGDNDIAIPEHLRYASNLRKSSGSKAVFNALFPPQASEQADISVPSPPDDVFTLLPKLRLAARLLLGDVNASDRLVERTLEQAIRDVDHRQLGQSTENWLNDVMREVAKARGAKLMH